MSIWKEESGGGLPAGVSTEAKQDVGNTSLNNIDTAIGAKSDVKASTDTGTFSLIALIKRLLDKLTSIISVRITDGAGTANTRQLGSQLTNADVGLITNTIMHGLTTGGGGGYVDVKVTPSGALTVESTISNFPAVQPVSDNGSSLTIDGSVSVSNFPSNQNIGLSDSINTDASARLRVSQFTTLGDLKILNEDDALLWETAGTGTGTFSGNKYLLTVDTGQYMIRRSKQYYHYFSGKSQVVEITFDEFQNEAGKLKRAGYFSSNAVAPYNTSLDGVWLENTGSTINLVISRFGTETFRRNITLWDNYNSISSYDWSLFTVILIDFLWLGGAVLRLFLKNPNGGFTRCHTFNYAGSQSDIFMLSPNHSVRYEIRSTTGTGSLHTICAQIATEGSTGEAGKRRSVNTGSTGVSYATIGTTYPVKAIRKKTLHRDRAVKVTGAQLFVSTNSDIALVTIQLNPTMSAALTYTNVANSAVQEANWNGTITVTATGSVLFSIIVTQNTVMNEDIFEEDFLSYLGVSIADVSDQIVLCITPITATITAFGCLQYKEY